MPPRVSLCMIVKNEEAHLAGCLESAADLVHEIIVVDTGSTDRTREVASRFGARLFDFPWVDSFAAARNESLRHATGEWIFWLDADDRIDEDNRRRLRTLFAQLPDDNIAYIMTYLALREAGLNGGNSAADHVQLFRNHPQIRWEYRVHEQIMPSVERLGGSARRTDVVIFHIGYQDADVVRRKLERNLRLLLLEHADRPDDPFTLFNLGRSLLRVGRVGEAVAPLTRSLELLPAGNDFIIRTAYALLVETHCRLRQFSEAFQVTRAGRGRFPLDPELLLAEGLVRRDLGDRAGAEACLVQLLQWDPNHAAAHFHLTRLRPGPSFFQFNVGT
jgi:glycosyltransferase involved in cell wall biosynthesis